MVYQLYDDMHRWVAKFDKITTQEILSRKFKLIYFLRRWL